MSPLYQLYPASDIIEVVSGYSQEKDVFKVHSELLFQASDSIRLDIADGTDFIECEDGVMRWSAPGDNEGVDIFLRWLYSGDVVDICPEDREDNKVRWLFLTWEMANRLSTTDFQDAIVDEITRRLFANPQLDVLDILRILDDMSSGVSDPHGYMTDLENTGPGKLVVDWFVHGGVAFSEGTQQQIIHVFDNTGMMRLFAQELLKQQASGGHADPPHLHEPCKYHVHVELNTPCHKTKPAR